MKKLFKKALSMVLCLSIVFSVFAVAAPTTNAAGTYTDIPVIYIEGQGYGLGIPQEGGGYDKIYGLEIPEDYIMNAVKENIDVFLLAVLTQQWGDFCDVLYEKIAPLFAEIKLDEKGQPTNGSKVLWDWSKETINPSTVNGQYEFEQFRFHYDWRLSPYEIAEEVHDYIEAVLEVTGEEEVALFGRCLGSCVTMAYMEMYDGEYIADHILYCSALKGVDFCSEAFSGNLYLDADGVERFVYDIDLGLSQVMTDFLQSFVTVANQTQGLDLALWSINNVIPQIKLDLFPRVLRDTFGSFPSYWAMVGEDRYEEAKEVVFHGADMELYADFIELIDSYHYNVQVPAEEIIKEQHERGIDYYNITKYGKQSIPVTSNSDFLSDSYVDIPGASLGATVGTINDDLSEDYIAGANAKYISPDNKIDASTCIYPDKTWFVKNLGHTTFPNMMNIFFAEMVNVEDYSIDSNPSYPQYLVYDKTTDSIAPMTTENEDTTAHWNVSFWDALKKLIESIIQLIQESSAAE